MVRAAVAFALALLIQGAFAAPSCGCAGPISLPLPNPYAGYAYPDAGAVAYDGVSSAALPGAYDAGAYAPLAGAYAPLAGAYAPGLNYADAGLYAPAPVSSTPLTPVGSPAVVGTSAGPATAYTTGPVCKTATFDVPIKSTTSAVAGPVAVSSAIVDGYCSTSCPATRAKCGGTTKNVSFKTPTIINKGSRTYSSISAIGNAVTTRSTNAGTPLVSTKVSPGPSYPASPVYGPGAYAPGAYAPGAYAPGAYAPGVYAPGAYAPDAYALGATPYAANLGAAILPAGPVGCSGVYPAPAPAPSSCACACV